VFFRAGHPVALRADARQNEKKAAQAQGHESSGSDGVQRRPSQRQQEKAPEGREPRMVDEDGAGPAEGLEAHGDDDAAAGAAAATAEGQDGPTAASRFHENL
jgi:hypothetical protein